MQDGSVFTNGPASHHRDRLPYIFHWRDLLRVTGASPRAGVQEGKNVSDPGAVYFAEHSHRVKRFEFFHHFFHLVAAVALFVPIIRRLCMLEGETRGCLTLQCLQLPRELTKSVSPVVGRG